MEFASEADRQKWVSEENERGLKQNAATEKASASAVEKYTAERNKRLEAEREQRKREAAEAPPRRGPAGRTPDGTQVAAPPGADEGGADDEFEQDAREVPQGAAEGGADSALAARHPPVTRDAPDVPQGAPEEP